jgi:hypothetical protein
MNNDIPGLTLRDNETREHLPPFTNVTVQESLLLLRIWKVTDSNLDPKMAILIDFPWYSSLSPGELCLGTTLK